MKSMLLKENFEQEKIQIKIMITLQRSNKDILGEYIQKIDK